MDVVVEDLELEPLPGAQLLKRPCRSAVRGDTRPRAWAAQPAPVYDDIVCDELHLQSVGAAPRAAVQHAARSPVAAAPREGGIYVAAAELLSSGSVQLDSVALPPARAAKRERKLPARSRGAAEAPLARPSTAIQAWLAPPAEDGRSVAPTVYPVAVATVVPADDEAPERPLEGAIERPLGVRTPRCPRVLSAWVMP